MGASVIRTTGRVSFSGSLKRRRLVSSTTTRTSSRRMPTSSPMRTSAQATEGGSLVAGGAPLSATECHRAANYGAAVRRVRGLVNPTGSKPVWAYVELGHPFDESDWPTITPPQVRAAVWQSLIAGARGIVYFNHSFGGPHQTQQILRDGAVAGSFYASIRSQVTATNRRIKALAPVLNSPTVRSGWSQGPGTTAMVKWSVAGRAMKRWKRRMQEGKGRRPPAEGAQEGE